MDDAERATLLLAALKRFGSHKWPCPKVSSPVPTIATCICGYDRVLETLATEDTEPLGKPTWQERVRMIA